MATTINKTKGIVYLITYILLIFLNYLINKDGFNQSFNDFFSGFTMYKMNYYGLFIIYMFFNPFFAGLFYFLFKNKGITLGIILNIIFIGIILKLSGI